MKWAETTQAFKMLEISRVLTANPIRGPENMGIQEDMTKSLAWLGSAMTNAPFKFKSNLMNSLSKYLWKLLKQSETGKVGESSKAHPTVNWVWWVHKECTHMGHMFYWRVPVIVAKLHPKKHPLLSICTYQNTHVYIISLQDTAYRYGQTQTPVSV